MLYTILQLAFFWFSFFTWLICLGDLFILVHLVSYFFYSCENIVIVASFI
jgi:hypothetical protein